MLRRRTRRALALSLVVLGALLMYLAPEMWGGGLAMLIVGVVVELVGIALERRT